MIQSHRQMLRCGCRTYKTKRKQRRIVMSVFTHCTSLKQSQFALSCLVIIFSFLIRKLNFDEEQSNAIMTKWQSTREKRCLSVCLSPFFSEMAKWIFVKLSEVHQWVLGGAFLTKYVFEKKNWIFDNHSKVVFCQCSDVKGNITWSSTPFFSGCEEVFRPQQKKN